MERNLNGKLIWLRKALQQFLSIYLLWYFLKPNLKLNYTYQKDQKSGMTLSDFKGNKNQQVLTSCLNLPNTNLKLGNLQEFIAKNWNHLIEKNIVLTNGPTNAPTRGFILLPSSINNIKSIKRNSLLEEFNLHMCCLTKSNDQQTVYAHMFKSSGIKIKRKILDSNDLILILVSAYMVLISKVIVLP